MMGLGGGRRGLNEVGRLEGGWGGGGGVGGGRHSGLIINLQHLLYSYFIKHTNIFANDEVEKANERDARFAL